MWDASICSPAAGAGGGVRSATASVSGGGTGALGADAAGAAPPLGRPAGGAVSSVHANVNTRSAHAISLDTRAAQTQAVRRRASRVRQGPAGKPPIAGASPLIACASRSSWWARILDNDAYKYLFAWE